MKSNIIIIIMVVFTIQKPFAQSEVKISMDSLPHAVKEHLHKKYHDYSSSNIMKLTDISGKISYKLDVQNEKKGDGKSTVYIYHLIYDPTGKLLSKLKEKEVYYTGAPKSKPVKSNDGHSGHQH